MAESMADPTEANPGARQRALAWTAAAVLVAIPLLLLQLVEPFAWQPAHAVFGTAIVVAVGALYEAAVRIPPRRAFVAGVALAALGIALTVWFNGAVGIIGSDDDPANRVFLVVIGVALTGLAIGAFRPGVLPAALVATAVAQAGVFVWALVGGHGFIGPITVFFCALWLAAAALVRRGLRQRAHRRGAG